MAPKTESALRRLQVHGRADGQFITSRGDGDDYSAAFPHSFGPLWTTAGLAALAHSVPPYFFVT